MLQSSPGPRMSPKSLSFPLQQPPWRILNRHYTALVFISWHNTCSFFLFVCFLAAAFNTKGAKALLKLVSFIIISAQSPSGARALLNLVRFHHYQGLSTKWCEGLTDSVRDLLFANITWTFESLNILKKLRNFAGVSGLVKNVTFSWSPTCQCRIASIVPPNSFHS